MTSKIVVNNIEADAGVSTVTFNSNVERGSSNLHSTGLNVNNTFVHSSGISLGAGSTVGAVTGVTTYYGDGSNLTGITQTTINNNGNNKVITGSGTANRLEAEDGFLYNGVDEASINHVSTNENSYVSIVANANRRKALQFKNASTIQGCIGLGDSDEATSTSLFLSASANVGGASPHMVITSAGYITQPNTPSFHAVGMSGSSYDNGTMTGSGSGPSHNIGNHYDGSTGIFTAPIAGRYLTGCGVLVQSGSGRLEGNISKNNSQVVANFNGTGTTYDGCTATAVVNLAANDTLRVKRDSGNAYDSNHGQHYFFAHLIG